MIIKVNGGVLDIDNERWYCEEHKTWNYCDDEMYCCAAELESKLISQERWAEQWKKLSSN